jgi:hypothetical protein
MNSMVERLRICAAIGLCMGCGEPLVVPVEVTLRDSNVAHPREDAGEVLPEGASDSTPIGSEEREPVADAGTLEDAAKNGGPAPVATVGLRSPCYPLPDALYGLGIDFGEPAPGMEAVYVSTDMGLACGTDTDGGADAEPQVRDGSVVASPDSRLHATYQRVNEKPILLGGQAYSLSLPAESGNLSTHVFIAGVYGGNVPCAETETLGSVVSLPLGGPTCIDLMPARDSKFLRLAIGFSAAVVPTTLTLELCPIPCDAIKP